MTRNLDRRVELMFPIEDPAQKAAVMHIVRAMFLDNVKARRLGPDGTYTLVRPAPGEPPYREQQVLQDEAHRRTAQARERAGVTFVAQEASVPDR
jgi:polyphosphate kinase